MGHPLLPRLPDSTRASPPTTTSATSDGEIDEKGLSGDADGVTRELGCFCACALGRHAPRWRRQMTPRAARPRVTPPLTTNLHRPPQTRNPLTTNKAAGSREGHSKIEGILYLQGTQVVEEKGFNNQTWVGGLRLQFYSAQLVGVDGQHAMTAKSTTQLKRPNDDRRQPQPLTAEVISYYADSAMLFILAATPIRWGDSGPLAAGARAICFFFPRCQPCLVCWLLAS